MKIYIVDIGFDPSVSCRFGQDPPPLEKRGGPRVHDLMVPSLLEGGVAAGRGGFFVHFLCLSKVNEPKERTPNTRNFSAFDGKPIQKLRVEQVLLSFGAFVIYSALWGLWF